MTYPIQVIEKKDTLVIMLKKQADELNNAVKKDRGKIKKLSEENERLKLKCNSLISKIHSFKNVKDPDTVGNLRSMLKKLSLGGCLLYSVGGGDSSVYFIRLNKYHIIFKANEVVKFIPSKLKIKAKTASIGASPIPNPQNLSLHFIPHDYIGTKFNF